MLVKEWMSFILLDTNDERQGRPNDELPKENGDHIYTDTVAYKHKNIARYHLG